MRPTFYGKIAEGKLILKHRETFNRYLQTLNNKEVELTIGQKRTSRSVQQNKYYWGVILLLVSQHTGFTPKECHEVFKKKFLTYWKLYKKHKYAFTRSTTTLDLGEFADYMEKIRQFVAESFKFYIPDPNEFGIEIKSGKHVDKRP